MFDIPMFDIFTVDHMVYFVIGVVVSPFVMPLFKKVLGMVGIGK